MCSISGYISFTGHSSKTVKDKIRETICKAETRGKDSFGYVTISNSGEEKYHKFVDKPTNVIDRTMDIPDDTFIVMNNNRAEPTTEYVENKTVLDVQPFTSEECIVVHNGTIANDMEIKEKLKLNLNTPIDSAVIPYMFDDLRDDESIVDLLKNGLIGSYAMACYNKKTETLYLATNYKPLNIAYDKSEDVLYFTSLESYIKSDDYNEIYSDFKVQEVKPYTLMVIKKGSNEIKSYSLYNEKEGKKKALILASAGMDSTVAASWAKDKGYDVTLMHFDYHCRAASKETEQIHKIAERLDAPVVPINIDFFRDVIKGSRLTDTKAEITKEGEAGAELAIEWVPARNLIFFSIATGYAEAHDIDYIVLGGNLEESGAYPDNELIFQQKFDGILPYSLNLQNRVQILTPVADFMKHDIVRMGLDLDAPLDLTWSCYEAGEKHCGECGPCFMRKTAFKMLGENEVIDYLNDEITTR